MLWGVGVLALLGAVSWLLRGPTGTPGARAFGVLALYGLLFWVTLAKVWWTAGSPAVRIGVGRLEYQPLHVFRPRVLELSTVLGCAPREGTQALRFVHRGRRGEERELYLNLGVVDGRHDFLERLGAALEGEGLAPVPGQQAWRRTDWNAW
jgi:hypothetical protein